MALQFQDIEISFAKGISGKESPKISQAPLALNNACFDEVGSINKRRKYDTVGGAITSAKNLIDMGGYPLVYCRDTTTSGALKQYDTNSAAWIARGSYEACRVDVDTGIAPAPASVGDVRTLDHVLNTNLSYVVSNTGAIGSAYARITCWDESEKSIVFNSTLSTMTLSEKLLKIGSSGNVMFGRLYPAATLGNICSRKFGIDATALPALTVTDLAIGVSKPWDVCSWTTGKAIILWTDVNMQLQISVYDYATDAIDSTTATGLTGWRHAVFTHYQSAIGCCVLSGASPKLAIFWHDNGTGYLKYKVFDNTLTQVVAPTNIFDVTGMGAFARLSAITACDSDGIDFRLYASFIDYTDTLLAHHTLQVLCAWGAATVGTLSYYPWSIVYSRAEKVHGSVYLFMRSATYPADDTAEDRQPALYLVRNNLTPIAHALYQDDEYSIARNLSAVGDDEVGVIANLVTETLIASRDYYRLSTVCSLKSLSSIAEARTRKVFVTLNPFFQHLKIDNNHLLTGGFLSSVEHLRCDENGHLRYPMIYDLATSSGTGNLTDGTYYVKVVAECVDAAGQLHRSAPSPAEKIVLSAGGALQTIIVQVCNQYFTRRSENVRFVVYRTPVGGSTFYYAGIYGSPGAATTYSQFVTITCLASDATIQTNEILYTEGGEREVIHPPCPISICKSIDRVFLLSGDDNSEVWFSKPKAEGYATEFSNQQIIRYPEKISAIWFWNNVLWGFSKDKIYSVTGDGPNALGQGSQFSLPALYSSVVGCENPFSFVETPQGLIFQAGKCPYPVPPDVPSSTLNQSNGIWILGSSGAQQVSELEEWRQFTVTSAKILPRTNQALLTLWGFYANKSVILAYDFVVGQWSIHLQYESGADYPYYTFGEVVDGIHWIVSNRYLYKQSLTTFGSADTLRIQSAWIKPGQLVSGFGRVRYVSIMGTYKSAHTLTIKVYYDYDLGTLGELITTSISASQVPYLYRFKPNRQKCNAILIEIYDADQAGTYESFSLDGLMLNVGRKTKQVLPAARTL